MTTWKTLSTVTEDKTVVGSRASMRVTWGSRSEATETHVQGNLSFLVRDDGINKEQGALVYMLRMENSKIDGQAFTDPNKKYSELVLPTTDWEMSKPIVNSSRHGTHKALSVNMTFAEGDVHSVKMLLPIVNGDEEPSRLLAAAIFYAKQWH
ncbi:hypothetical protein SEMRO_1005_G230210.1 [Seminavis robusta]|uniref:Uncharacterized protein n=1 Tax=Seminavis robusta TaxID=568900 RepID=A0A9N8EHJ0_9STRA|nr:hypothetical protein SEMRO_1005_G230210.1 [Seminavis robusta]|eukprot:Sro1005_g230210.1 n/a (152) ;mRNA; r:11289-11744